MKNNNTFAKMPIYLGVLTVSLLPLPSKASNESIQLTLVQLNDMLLTNNLDIRKERFNFQTALIDIDQQFCFSRPKIDLSLGQDNSRNYVDDVLRSENVSLPPSFLSKRYNASLTWSQKLFWNNIVNLTLNNYLEYQNSTYINRYNIGFSITQPLNRNMFSFDLMDEKFYRNKIALAKISLLATVQGKLHTLGGLYYEAVKKQLDIIRERAELDYNEICLSNARINLRATNITYKEFNSFYKNRISAFHTLQKSLIERVVIGKKLRTLVDAKNLIDIATDQYDYSYKKVDIPLELVISNTIENNIRLAENRYNMENRLLGLKRNFSDFASLSLRTSYNFKNISINNYRYYDMQLDNFYVSIMLSIPLYDPSHKEEGKKLQQVGAQANIDSEVLRARLIEELTDLYYSLMSKYEEIEIEKVNLSIQGQSWKEIQIKYTDGIISRENYLMYKKQFLAVDSNYHRLIVEYHAKLAELRFKILY